VGRALQVRGVDPRPLGPDRPLLDYKPAEADVAAWAAPGTATRREIRLIPVPERGAGWPVCRRASTTSPTYATPPCSAHGDRNLRVARWAPELPTVYSITREVKNLSCAGGAGASTWMRSCRSPTTATAA